MLGDCYKYGANSGKVYSEQVIASRECKDDTGAFTLDTTLEDKQPGDPLLTINVPETYEDGTTRVPGSLYVLIFTSVNDQAGRKYYWYNDEDIRKISIQIDRLDPFASIENVRLLQLRDQNGFPATATLMLDYKLFDASPETGEVYFNDSITYTWNPETGDIKVESKIAEDQAKVFAKDAFEVERK